MCYAVNGSSHSQLPRTACAASSDQWQQPLSFFLHCLTNAPAVLCCAVLRCAVLCCAVHCIMSPTAVPSVLLHLLEAAALSERSQWAAAAGEQLLQTRETCD
jgi:hypothetical protein